MDRERVTDNIVTNIDSTIFVHPVLTGGLHTKMSDMKGVCDGSLIV